MEARRRAAASSMLPEDVGDDFDGNRAIIKNRGRVKIASVMKRTFTFALCAPLWQLCVVRVVPTLFGVPVALVQQPAYDGEASGIRTRLARSHKL